MTSPQQPQPQPERGPHDTGAQTQPIPPAAPPAPAGEAGTMMLKAQEPPAPAPAREAGTMMLQAQPMPEPQPLAAHGPGKDAGTMMLQAPQAQPPQPQAPAPAPPQPGPVGYVSPIPVRPAHLGHALASEWTKIRSVRSTIWTLGIMVVLILGISLMAAAALGSPDREVDPKLGFSFLGILLGTLCLIPLGVLVISSEYGTGMIRTTMTACPNRARVLAAKSVVFSGLAFVITTLTTTLVALIFNGLVNGPAPTADQWLRATVGVGLYVSLLGLLALAVGSLLRHSAGAISAMLGVVLLPMLLAVFMIGSESLQEISKALISYSVPNSLATLYDNPFLGTESGPQGWTPLWIMAGLTAVVLGGAFAAQAKRDV
ncbi:iron ABC transporter permease [Streptomyces sp. NBRC 110611]|uniref:ABC transporter permease subunit n=1 Tax=Streptomyces sp. NBRC 110611 TaxID=1621259 RepID=UPI000857239E|nr:ABC transporter permease subunit [Streptomyces sp. NBRC 110611]GAU65500.1 iron ABC transporter permease [Streptomyces sp. NBRC 110611]